MVVIHRSGFVRFIVEINMIAPANTKAKRLFTFFLLCFWASARKVNGWPASLVNFGLLGIFFSHGAYHMR